MIIDLSIASYIISYAPRRKIARAEAEEKAFLEAEKEADDADINDGNDGGYDDVLPEELDAVIDAMAGGAEKSAEADDAADTLQADVEPQDIVELD